MSDVIKLINMKILHSLNMEGVYEQNFPKKQKQGGKQKGGVDLR